MVDDRPPDLGVEGLVWKRVERPLTLSQDPEPHDQEGVLVSEQASSVGIRNR